MLPAFQMVWVNFMCVPDRLSVRVENTFRPVAPGSTGGGTLHYRQHREMSHTHTLEVAVHLRLAARLETWLDSSLLCLSTPHMLWTRGENTLQGSGARNPTWKLQLSLGLNVLSSRYWDKASIREEGRNTWQKLPHKRNTPNLMIQNMKLCYRRNCIHMQIRINPSEIIHHWWNLWFVLNISEGPSNLVFTGALCRV